MEAQAGARTWHSPPPSFASLTTPTRTMHASPSRPPLLPLMGPSWGHRPSSLASGARASASPLATTQQTWPSPQRVLEASRLPSGSDGDQWLGRQFGPVVVRGVGEGANDRVEGTVVDLEDGDLIGGCGDDDAEGLHPWLLLHDRQLPIGVSGGPLGVEGGSRQR
ncbi:hypothetical protein GUJ93_ZPchr0010g8199 [Zizania palustris]|uniref:Uncharacterized protein n=1 Tax=Zizania palustris TaxID=103762 RepID=A0A8J6BHB7_ZIZPA|nr:hypothetical protein GUJ93_ZPchr0010g8199 [Zizania palustris]